MLLLSQPSDGDFDSDFDEAFDEEFEEAFRQLERQTARFPLMIVAIFLGVAVLMLSIAAVSGIGAWRSLSREESTPGRVVELVIRRDEGGYKFYYPVVEFYLPHEDRQTATLSEGSTSPGYTVGESVTVLYDPQRPTSARIKSVESAILKWLLPSITAVLAAAFFAATFLAIWILRPDSAEQE
ncbi:MAG: DUF3592 domain-containing protein [Chloroflexi bacterium]|nr:DUF3592 domain-containing protein [Chloroflexota bacterium]